MSIKAKLIILEIIIIFITALSAAGFLIGTIICNGWLAAFGMAFFTAGMVGSYYVEREIDKVIDSRQYYV